MPANAAGATLDLKKTSFKKLAKLLSVHEKKGLLSQVGRSQSTRHDAQAGWLLHCCSMLAEHNMPDCAPDACCRNWSTSRTILRVSTARMRCTQHLLRQGRVQPQQ